MEPLKELEHVLEEEVREHTHRAEEESQLAEKAFEKLEKVREEEEKEEEDRHHHKVKMVVDGVPVEVAFEEQEKLGDLIPRALEEAGHVYKPEDRWQVKYDGKVLDLATKMCDLKLPKNATLFLSLEAGTLG
jgi:hypothetical protein